MPHVNHVLRVAAQVAERLLESGKTAFKALHQVGLHDFGQLVRDAVGREVTAAIDVFHLRVDQVLDGTVTVVTQEVVGRVALGHSGRYHVHGLRKELRQTCLHGVFQAVRAADGGKLQRAAVVTNDVGSGAAHQYVFKHIGSQAL